MSGLEIGSPMVHTGWVMSLDADAPRGKVLAACSDGSVYRWDVETGVGLRLPLRRSRRFAMLAMDCRRLSEESMLAGPRGRAAATLGLGHGCQGCASAGGAGRGGGGGGCVQGVGSVWERRQRHCRWACGGPARRRLGLESMNLLDAATPSLRGGDAGPPQSQTISQPSAPHSSATSGADAATATSVAALYSSMIC